MWLYTSHTNGATRVRSRSQLVLETVDALRQTLRVPRNAKIVEGRDKMLLEVLLQRHSIVWAWVVKRISRALRYHFAREDGTGWYKYAIPALACVESATVTLNDQLEVASVKRRVRDILRRDNRILGCLGEGLRCP